MGVTERKIFNNVFTNAISLGIFIIAQQIILMPFVHKQYPDKFAMIILMITVCNMLIGITAGALGNTMLVKTQAYLEKRLNGDYFLILSGLSIGSVFVWLILFYSGAIIISSAGEVAVFLVLYIFRAYFNSRVFLNKCYKVLLIQNALYFLGALLGMLIIKPEQPERLFLIAELTAVACYMKYYDLFGFNLTITEEFESTVKKYFNFSFVAVIDYFVNYADRLLIYPLLGNYALGLLFALTTTSKCLFLLIAPTKNVLSGMLAEVSDEKKKEVMEVFTQKMIQLFLPVYLLNILSSAICLRVLYADYWQDGCRLVFVVALALTFGVLNELSNVICMRFIEARKLSVLGVARLATFVSFALILTGKYQLYGFFAAMLIFHMLVFFAYLCLVRSTLANLK